MVCHPELHLAPARCDKVSCDDTGRRPVFSGRQRRSRKGHYRLFHWQASDPSLWCPLSQYLDKIWQESLLQRSLYWAKGVSYVWGDLLRKCSLLLE